MKRSVIIILHLGYWIMYILLISSLLVALAANSKFDPATILRQTFSQPPVLVVFFLPGLLGFYGFYSYLFQRWLTKQDLKGFFAAGLATVVICGLIPVLLLSIPGLQWQVNRQWKAMLSIWVVLTILATIHGVIGLVMKGFITWYDEIKLKEDLKKKNLETELALLKSQLNPHFLFNTINNIDVLIGTDATRASLYLNKLSDILRFMLYETQTEQIPLRRELEYIDKYLALQKIRSAHPDYIRYSVEGDPGNWLISPMLLISYIENAFKHAESFKSGNAIIIRVVILPERLYFYCENKYRTNKTEKKDHSGLGNELLRKRLDLLYPGIYRLTITDKDETYIVELSIENDEHRLHHSGR